MPTRSTFRAELFTVALMSFAAGVDLAVGLFYLVEGKWLAWAFVVSAAMFVVAAIVVGRRLLNRLDTI